MKRALWISLAAWGVLFCAVVLLRMRRFAPEAIVEGGPTAALVRGPVLVPEPALARQQPRVPPTGESPTAEFPTGADRSEHLPSKADRLAKELLAERVVSEE